MRILLIRYGSRRRDREDAMSSLSAEGKTQMCQLADKLKAINLLPSIYMSSHHVHAKESANLLAQKLSNTTTSPTISLRSLAPTPEGSTFSFDDIVAETGKMQWDRDT